MKSLLSRVKRTAKKDQTLGDATAATATTAAPPANPPSSAAPLTAPTPPPPPPVASPPVSSTQGVTLDPWSAEGLWKDAYEKFKQDEPELAQSFEQTSGAAGLVSPLHMQSDVKSRLETREERQWIVTLAGKSVHVREMGERLIKFILWSKDVVSSALSSKPHVALAWSGVTMLFPLALIPSEESDAMIEGLDHIASLLRLYDIRARLRHETTVDEYRLAIVQLYAHVLEYEVRMACHLAKHTMSRGVHSIMHSGLWSSLVKKIDSADQYCQQHEVLIDKDLERAEWKKQSEHMERSHKIQEQILDAMRNFLDTRAAEREDDRKKEILQCLSADYPGHKNLNPKRVPQTCRWFLDDQRFHQWRDSDDLSLLWLSTGPGCGKSVLSRALIDEMLLTTRMMTSTVCYFFFKDGLERRQRGEDALCGILHQIYSQNLASDLISHAYQPYQVRGSGLRSMFYPLWDLLIATARDQSVGEIICLLDALDECQADARDQLLDQLNQFFEDYRANGTNKPRIKFLISSRPNNDIHAKFHNLDPSVNFIEFAGDDRSDLIRQEIDLVIENRIPEVASRLDGASQALLIQRLKSIEHRTYLWLHLVLKEVQLRISSYATVKRIGALIDQLPMSIAQAYESILNRSSESEVARLILKIVLVAKRPLTVNEMTVAVAIERTTLPKSYEDLDLEPEEVRESNLRDICGFFISIHESKVSLIHQTAREFLIRSITEGGLSKTALLIPNARWQHSIDLIDAEYLVARVCTTLLMFRSFGEQMPWTNYHGHKDEWQDKYGPQVGTYPLLEYASTTWFEHHRDAQHLFQCNEIGILQLICDVQQGHCETWFPIYWYSEKWERRSTITSLVLASALGIFPVVEQIVCSPCASVASADQRPVPSIDEPCVYFGTALQAATVAGHFKVVKLLVDKGADINFRGPHDLTALNLAAAHGHLQMVKLFVEAGADLEGIALQVASANGKLDVVKLLVDHGADVNATAEFYGTALHSACEGPHLEVFKFLVDRGAKIDAQAGTSRFVLQAASLGGNLEIVKFLIGRGADVNALGGSCGTALQAASIEGHLEVVRLLVDEGGADVNKFGGRYGTALCAASIEGHLEVVRLLIDEGGADVNNVGGRYGTALGAASSHSHLEVIRLLIDEGADVNIVGGDGGTALHAAVIEDNLEVVRLLINEGGADVNIVGGGFGTVLCAASANGYLEAVRLLIDKGADANAVVEGHDTALQAASRWGYLEVVRVLINEGGADVNVVTGRYGTALQAASIEGHLEVVRLLLDEGADVNIVGGEYGTALQAASYIGHLEVVRLLLDEGADVNIVGGEYGTALRAAEDGGHGAIASLLRERGAQ